MSTAAVLLAGLIFCSLVMLLAWFMSLRTQFYSLIDVIWTFGIGALTLLYAFISESFFIKKVIAVVMALFWSLRLGTYLVMRLKAHYPAEDKRYVTLKKKWGKKQFFVFFQFQGISQVLFGLPFLFTIQDIDPSISKISYLGMIVFLIGLLGETLADKQLSHFRSAPQNQGKVCDRGLWKYSRHPNYFFEWIIWCGIAIVAIPTQNGFIGLLAPILMYLTLNYITGIPAAEEQSIKSKGDLYKEYQRKTNCFFPGFPKI